MRLILSNQYKKLKLAFKMFKLDINIYLNPILANIEEFKYDEFPGCTFLTSAIKSGCSYMTKKILIDLGSDLNQPDYNLYCEENIFTNFFTNDYIINYIEDELKYVSTVVIDNQDWKLLRYMYKKNKNCITSNLWYKKRNCWKILENKDSKYLDFLPS
jgi:hypothetical protein